MTKSFKEHLLETSFYFKTINDPSLTIYGQKVTKTDEDEKKSKDKKVDAKEKDLATNPQEKLTTYLKIVNNIQ